MQRTACSAASSSTTSTSAWNGLTSSPAPPGQQNAFHDYYRSTQEQYYYLFGEDIIGSVRRLGLITFRLAMVLSALRLHDTSEVVTTLICDDEDFRSGGIEAVISDVNRSDSNLVGVHKNSV